MRRRPHTPALGAPILGALILGLAGCVAGSDPAPAFVDEYWGADALVRARAAGMAPPGFVGGMTGGGGVYVFLLADAEASGPARALSTHAWLEPRDFELRAASSWRAVQLHRPTPGSQSWRPTEPIDARPRMRAHDVAAPEGVVAVLTFRTLVTVAPGLYEFRLAPDAADGQPEDAELFASLGLTPGAWTAVRLDATPPLER